MESLRNFTHTESMIDSNDTLIRRDSFTTRREDHSFCTGVGTAAGVLAGMAGAAALGAASGAIIGPIGAIAGAAVGGIAGHYVGKAIAEDINPLEDAYWRAHYHQQETFKDGDYETYQPAFHFGVKAYASHKGRPFDAVEGDLQKEWKKLHPSAFSWNEARHAARAAYERLYQSEKEKSIRASNIHDNDLAPAG